VREVEVLGAKNLAQVVAHLAGRAGVLARMPVPEITTLAPPDAPRLEDVRGQETAKLALAVAAAGEHGLLFVGPPGVGKSMLARRLSGILPPPELDLRLEITRVQSAAGRLSGGLATHRPFRAPHHTVGYAGLVGGGPHASPGEITLAHGGVLFLDELPEFRREVLEALRQPLETGTVLISRAGRQVEYPARFQLVAAMNPCPCGYRGHGRTPCACTPAQVDVYRGRISGPLLDRVDLRVELSAPSLDEWHRAAREDAELSTAALAARVAAARARQHGRQGARTNGELDARALDELCPLDGAGRALLERAAARRELSGRALVSLRRVALTLADLDGEDRPGAEHVARALALRAPLSTRRAAARSP
jgi:magnesium chelatase family protein